MNAHEGREVDAVAGGLRIAHRFQEPSRPASQLDSLLCPAAVLPGTIQLTLGAARTFCPATCPAPAFSLDGGSSPHASKATTPLPKGEPKGWTCSKLGAHLRPLSLGFTTSHATSGLFYPFVPAWHFRHLVYRSLLATGLLAFDTEFVMPVRS